MRAVLLACVVGAAYVGAVAGDCCVDADADDKFCQLYHLLSVPEKVEIHEIWGENCDAHHDDVSKAVEKRKPNFLRFGKRSADDEDDSEVDKKADGPTFLRFGRKPNFLRFGKRKPNFLRFGKRKPNFLRFGKRKPNFLRFGRSVSLVDEDDMMRSVRKPNFLRFGKRKPNFLRFG